MIDIWKNRDWKPMLLKETDKPFDSKDYIYELKFDGIRAIIFANEFEIKVQSRNKQDLTHLFPELQNIKTLVNKKTIFDGEIVAFENGVYSFSKLQKRLHLKDSKKINLAAINNPITFVAFDILYEDKNLTALTLLKRKKYLNKYKDTDEFIKVKTIDTTGISFFEKVKKMNLEGIVAKLKNGKYYINKRCDEFIKIKNIKREEFLIGGYEEKKNNILSLAIGEYIGNKFYYVGKVAIGKKYKIYEHVLKQKNTKNFFVNYNENIKYIKPTIKCHIEYLERTKNNHLRHPILNDY